jgi:hypothetical protein
MTRFAAKLAMNVTVQNENEQAIQVLAPVVRAKVIERSCFNSLVFH